MKVSKRHLTIAGACLAFLAFLLGATALRAIRLQRASSASHSAGSETILLIQGLLQKKAPVFLSPEFLPAPPSDIEGLSALAPGKKESEAALNDAAFFHSLHREKHFSVILLAPSRISSPLGAALLASPLWTLTDVLPSGYLFRPAGSVPWSPPDEEVIVSLHPDSSDRARWLIGTAANLIAIKRTKEAEQLLVYAKKTNSLSSPLLATEASLAATRGRWNEALSLSRQSLAKDPSNTPARLIMIRALIECGKSDEAFAEAKKLRSLPSSSSAESLFLLARAANAANDKVQEINALRDLVSLARRQHQPLGASLTYLGQAYAQAGERGMALKTLQEALSSPELTGEQREMIAQLITHLKPEEMGRPGR